MAHTLTQVRDWNASLKDARPEVVALFAGGTSGIGRSTAVKLASAIACPTIYIVGRNQAAGAQVLEELKAANKNGSYSFMAADVSHLRNVDEVCQKLQSNIEVLDLLFLSSGGLTFSKKEGDAKIDVNHILRYYSRMRFIYNLLPTLEVAKSPRVVSVLASGKEMKIEEDNLDLQKDFSFSASTGYPATMTSLAFEILASQHPSINFIHVFPGIVATSLMKKSVGSFMGSILSFITKPISMSASESGEWHVFLSTSTEFRARNASSSQPSGGSYIVNYDGKNVSKDALMAELRGKGFLDTVWKHTLDTFDRLL
ncbi:short-chain dehydrogenases/reductase [Penicillium herquei]|nr:short-chain dehydrogenases/reductase [Penicillium herquei]